MKRERPPAAPNERTLEELTGVDWGTEPAYSSHLVVEHFRLGRMPIGKMTAADLRLMIGQHDGLPWLVPLAIERLRGEPWLEAHFHPGDLLDAVLKVPEAFWSAHPQCADLVDLIVSKAVFRADPPRRRKAVPHQPETLALARAWAARRPRRDGAPPARAD